MTITLDANGGTVTPSSITRNFGDRVGALPTPTRANYNFVGWYTAATGGTRITAATIVPANNVTYFARWAAELVSTTSTYTYRADGLRHSKTVNGVTTYHVWDRGNIVLELNAAGAVINRFERGARGQLIRSQHHGFYLHDARGSVVQRVDMNGNVLRNYWYTAFGIEFFPNFTNSNPFQFNAEYWDSHRGEYYLRARSYNPRTGRFSQPDPFWNVHNMAFGNSPVMMNGRPVPNPWAMVQAGNLFMYCMHNPVMFNDPSGYAFGPTALMLGIVGMLLLGATGATLSINSANRQGLTGWDRYAYIGLNTLLWSASGFVGAYAFGPALVAATGIIGINVTTIGVTITTVSSPWLLGPVKRGQAIERILGANLPQNFPTIDKAVQGANNIASSITSIKSIDLASKTYQQGSALFNRIMNYSHKVANFTNRTWAGETVNVNNSTQRILEVAIPHGATQAQWTQIHKATVEAAKIGVEVVPIVIR